MKQHVLEQLSYKAHYKYYLLIVIAIFLVFGNTVGNGYNMDDNLVTQHHSLTSSKNLSTIIEIFKTPYYLDNMGYSYGYRPVVLLSFFFEHYIFGEGAKVSHFINILLYAITALLLFKLLIAWFGEKSLILSVLSVAIFAIHPLHSEVVASIKNRDEILALLFIVLSGLAIIKYLSHNNWIYLFYICCFSLLAVLSKKSIYSMALILPIAAILFKEIGIKQLILFSIVLIVPMAIIGSNLKIERAVFLSALPLLSTFGFYYLRKSMQKDWSWSYNKQRGNILRYSISWFLMLISINQHDNSFLILYLIFLIIIFKNDDFGFVVQTVIQLIILSLFFNLRDLSMMAIILSVSYYTYSSIEKNYNNKLLLLSIAASLFTLAHGYSIGDIGDIIIISLFFYIVIRSSLLALLFAVTLFIGSAFFGMGFWHLMILAYSVINYLDKRKKSNYYFRFASIIIVPVFYLLSSSFSYYQARIESMFETDRQVDNISTEIHQSIDSSEGVLLKENRPISYVENTLIVPHSKVETIGTGFSVLGEYLKLMFFPKELSFYYGYAKIKTMGLNVLSVWLSIIAHLGLLILAIWQFDKRPIISLGIIWYGLSIALFSNWPEMVAGMVGERLAFTASAGFSIFIAGIILWIKPNFSFAKPKGLELAVLTVLIILSVRTYSRNKEWKDPLTLMGNDIQHLENSAQANNLYATYLMQASVNRKNSQEAKRKYQTMALKHFNKAVSIYPDFFNANFDVGRVCIELGDFKGAKAAFEQAYKIKPDNLLAIEELTKTSFDLKQYYDVKKYGQMYLEKDNSNENVFELVAYTFLIEKDKVNASIYAEKGLNYFPGNKNLQLIKIESSK